VYTLALDSDIGIRQDGDTLTRAGMFIPGPIVPRRHQMALANHMHVVQKQTAMSSCLRYLVPIQIFLDAKVGSSEQVDSNSKSLT